MLPVAIVGAVISPPFKFVINVVVVMATPMTPVCRAHIFVFHFSLAEVVTIILPAISSLTLGICASPILFKTLPSFAASKCHVI
jgi:hypothetical protein